MKYIFIVLIMLPLTPLFPQDNLYVKTFQDSTSITYRYNYYADPDPETINKIAIGGFCHVAQSENRMDNNADCDVFILIAVRGADCVCIYKVAFTKIKEFVDGKMSLDIFMKEIEMVIVPISSLRGQDV